MEDGALSSWWNGGWTVRKSAWDTTGDDPPMTKPLQPACCSSGGQRAARGDHRVAASGDTAPRSP